MWTRRCQCYKRDMFRRRADQMLDWFGYLWTLARLGIYDRLAGPSPETPTDRAVREHGERLRQAFPQVDFDDPSRHARSDCVRVIPGVTARWRRISRGRLRLFSDISRTQPASLNATPRYRPFDYLTLLVLLVSSSGFEPETY